jgi:oligopeptide/dipeptide ABC transporter ATP-binding protein
MHDRRAAARADRAGARLALHPMAHAAMNAPLVRAENLSRAFRTRGLFGGAGLIAVRDVTLEVARGEAVGVVGESGCGKSTLGRLLIGLIAPTRGRVRFDGRDLAGLPAAELRRLRRRMQIVFQDPYASLDPRRPVGQQIADGLRIHHLADAAAVTERTAELVRLVGLDPAQSGRLPNAFSGGQRQRIAIARALATRPDFIVADEPVSSLDVSVQAQVINLLADLRQTFGLALVFISHDLHIVRHICERVVVMYLGRIVEAGPTADVFRAPAHPYTRALIAATPSIRPRARVAVVAGEPPSALAPPSGCVFRTRCAYAVPACAETVPPLVAQGPRSVACLRAAEAPWGKT